MVMSIVASPSTQNGKLQAAVPAAASAVASTSKLTIEREKKRIALRSANLDVWRSGPSVPKGPLDSNMKKNTAFIKRIRQTLGVETKEQLIKDVATLNLDKYIEEIVHAIPEGLGKCTTSKDCSAASESLSALHGRFDVSLFALPLSAILSMQLAAPNRAALQALPQEHRDKDEAARVLRQKVLLRVSAELAMAELVRQEKGKAKASTSSEAAEEAEYPGQEWLYTMLRDLLASDREHSNVPILITLLKALAPSLLGPVGDKVNAGDGSTEATDKMAALSLGSEEERVVKGDMQARFRKLCETYFGTIGKRIVKEHARLQDQDRRNHEAYIRSGEIFEDRQQSYEKMTRGFEKLHEWGKSLSDLLGVPLPPLTNEAKSTGIGVGVNLDSRSGAANERLEAEYASGKSLWEDEDTRRFYEDLLDLQDMVPISLLQQSTVKGKGEEAPTAADGATEAALGKDVSETPVVSPKLGQDEKVESMTAVPRSPPEKDGHEEAGMSAGPAAQLNAFLAGLPELSNRTMIDSAAVDFAFLNSKGARKRLVKQLMALPRNRSDLIPYYARLIATLNRYMPDIGQGVIAVLDEEFRYLQRKRNVDMAETRAKNLRFLGELVKFRVTPLITTLYCFKVCLDDFNGPNVDNIATLLETCGRFLLRSEETSERMQSTLELLRRKRGAQNLDARQLVLLDNAYYQCNPPERESIATKQRTPMERYISFLIYDMLKRGTQEAVMKQLRKLAWDDVAVRDTLHNVFVRSWRIKFSNLHLLAILLHDLQAYHPDFVVRVIDTICEQIRTGMETNIFKDNQRRVSTLKYLGELYNYRLINSDIIFEQLQSLVSFGHLYGRPLAGQVSPIDSPDDYFRIRLVCTLLDACGMCFDRGVLQKRLDEFLLFLNVYLMSKEQPIPMDIDFMLSDTLEVLRPTFTLKRTFEEAAVAIDAMLAERAAAEEQRAQAEAAKAPVLPEPVLHNGNDDHDASVSSASSSSGDSSDDSDDEDEEENEDGEVKATPRHVSKDDESTDSETSSSDSEDDDKSDVSGIDEEEEDEDALAPRSERSAVDQEAEDEFERELAKMMAENSSSAQHTKRGLFDIGLPFIRKASGAVAASASSGGQSSALSSAADAGSPPLDRHEGEAAPAPQHMRFSLLSKRGNRQQTHDVHVPIDAALAVHSRASEQQQLAEREQLKQLVLGFETREQAEERANVDSSLARRAFRLKQQPQAAQPGRDLGGIR